jgi:hypothetical protein
MAKKKPKTKTKPSRNRAMQKAGRAIRDKTKTIVIVGNGDDWEGIYVDGILQMEDHTLTAGDIIRILGIKAERKEVSSEWLGGEVGSLPERLSDIPEAVYDLNYEPEIDEDDCCDDCDCEEED